MTGPLVVQPVMPDALGRAPRSILVEASWATTRAAGAAEPMGPSSAPVPAPISANDAPATEPERPDQDGSGRENHRAPRRLVGAGALVVDIGDVGSPRPQRTGPR